MTRTYYYADCDCHHWSVEKVADELIAHRLAEHHARDSMHDYEDIDWSVIEQ